MPDSAPFYVEIPASVLPLGEHTVTLRSKVDDNRQEMAQINLVQNGDVWRSEKPLVFTSADADASAGDSSAYQFVRWPDMPDADWVQGGGSLEFDYLGALVPISANPQGMAIVSIGVEFKAGQGIDMENNVKKPFEKMGYLMYSDYNAKTPDVLNKYVKGKAIWYSLTHGGLSNGTGLGVFTGLSMGDNGKITAADLQSRELSYTLVIVDGCCSAHSSNNTEDEAKLRDDLLDDAREFANSFGDPETMAYVGWGWTTTPKGAHQWTAEFIAALGEGKTTKAALNKFRAFHLTDPAAKLLKLYGNEDLVIKR